MKIMQNRRIVWVDYAKFAGIYLVVLGHLPLSEDWVRFIYSFHIPLFFFISGYLHKASESSYESLKANVRSLLIPYMLLYFIFWLYPICKDLLSGNFSLSGYYYQAFFRIMYGKWL